MRKLATLLAILGMLLHAGLLVRHYLAVVAQHAELSGPTGFAAALCGAANEPFSPAGDAGHKSQSGSCPLCTGQGVAAAILAPTFAVFIASDVGHDAPFIGAQKFDVLIIHARPQPRAPPTFA